MDKKRIIILSIITFVFVIAGLLWIKIFETKTIYKEKIVYKEKEISNCEKVEEINLSKLSKEENIVFLGDSITEFYPIDKIYWNLPIVKSGISGFTSYYILDNMDEMVYQYNPTKVFLLIGTNDIMIEGEAKVDETVDNIKKIIENINKNREQATVYVESVYPIHSSGSKDMIKNRDNETIKKMNKKIKVYCQGNTKCVYINMYDELTDEDGEFSQEYTDDGLHPNDLGYAKISQVRLNYIYGIVGEDKNEE